MTKLQTMSRNIVDKEIFQMKLKWSLFIADYIV